MSSEGQIPAKGTRKKAKRQRRERGRLHLSPSSSGIWYMRGTVANTTINESTGTHSEEHAKAIRDKRERELLDSAVYGVEYTSTFADAVESYYENVSKTNSTCRHMPAIVKRIGDRKLREIKVADITKLAKDLYPTAKNTTRNTNVINPIRTIMLHAASQEMCERKMIPSLPDDSETVLGPPQGWIEAFLNGCENQHVKAAVAYMTTTAARTIEMCRLEWENIDFERQTATFLTKKGKLRTVALTGPVMKLIEGLPRGKGRVFGFADTNSFNKSLARQCEYLRMEHMSGHRVGRHAFAERMLALGYDCYTVCQMGDWDSIQVFKDRYGHLERAKTNDAVRKAGAELFSPKLKIVGGN